MSKFSSENAGAHKVRRRKIFVRSFLGMQVLIFIIVFQEGLCSSSAEGVGPNEIGRKGRIEERKLTDREREEREKEKKRERERKVFRLEEGEKRRNTRVKESRREEGS